MLTLTRTWRLHRLGAIAPVGQATRGFFFFAYDVTAFVPLQASLAPIKAKMCLLR